MRLLGVAKAQQALAGLPPQVRLMAQFLACAEQPDRVSTTVAEVWPALWERLGQFGDPPDPWDVLPALRVGRLVEYVKLPDPAIVLVGFRMDSRVAAAIAEDAPEQVRHAVAYELGRMWTLSAQQARQLPGGEDTGLVMQAALRAAPYLIRAALWDEASVMLEAVIIRGVPPVGRDLVVGMYRQVATATGSARHQAILARALAADGASMGAGPGLAEAEPLYRDAIRRFMQDGDHQMAQAVAAEFASLLLSSGRPAEAEKVRAQANAPAGLADAGPWTRLAEQVRDLEVLVRSGPPARVLAEVAELREHMATLPGQRADNDMVNPWSTREALLSVGLTAAMLAGDARQALEFHDEIIASMRQRNANPYQVARMQIYGAAALADLGRRAEAKEVLRDCLRSFEEYGDATMAQNVRTILASL
jgi:hypothetical protein